MSPATRMRPMPCEPCARAAVKWLLSHPPPNALNVMPRMPLPFSGVRIDRSKKTHVENERNVGRSEPGQLKTHSADPRRRRCARARGC